MEQQCYQPNGTATYEVQRYDPDMRSILSGLYGDWFWLNERIETVSKEIEGISRTDGNFGRLCNKFMRCPPWWIALHLLQQRRASLASAVSSLGIQKPTTN
ncbi:MAG: hypothetical protein WAO69_16385 [Aestuariivita sp.]